MARVFRVSFQLPPFIERSRPHLKGVYIWFFSPCVFLDQHLICAHHLNKCSPYFIQILTVIEVGVVLVLFVLQILSNKLLFSENQVCG